MRVEELAKIVDGHVVGDPETRIERIADLIHADEGEIAYVEKDVAAESKASCLIVRDGFAAKFPGRTVIEVANPKLAFALIGAALHPPLHREPTIHPTSVVAETADVALTAYVGPNVCVGEYAHVGAYTRLEAGVVLGANVTVGQDCVLHPNVVLYDGVTIGNGVILHAGVCLGADGFGYVRHDLGYKKVRTIGSVVLEDEAVIGGQVGFGDHTRGQSGAIIGSKAGILPGKIVRPGVWWGIPIQRLDEYKRLNAHLSRVPAMRDELKELKDRVKELEQQLLKRDL